MPDDLQLIEADKRYSMFSGLTLLAIPISCSVSYLIFGNHTWLNAVALLLVPFAVFCWIFTTIKGIHLVGVQFWFIPSTYVTLIGGVISFVMSATMLLASQESAKRGQAAGDYTLYAAAAILYGGCAGWSCWYNWRRTGSTVLAISLTILQTMSAVFVIGVFNLWLDRKNTKRYEREHGLG
jgi:hypothetical protein